jgi:AcrR family transcriptional regulator
MKTIKQIADELGVSKQRVYRHIRANHISEAHHKRGVMWFDEAVEAAVARYFSDEGVSHEVHHDVLRTTSGDTVVDTVVLMLQRELDAKNQQIADLTAALIGAQEAARAAQALHAGTIQTQLGDGQVEGRRGLLARVFRRTGR